MKAVRSTEGGVSVVDLDEPPGTGELLVMKAMSICASDLAYIRFGSRSDLTPQTRSNIVPRMRREFHFWCSIR
jgi:threonine dehydrogenase-like Zn-dependent dehydrogenase